MSLGLLLCRPLTAPCGCRLFSQETGPEGKRNFVVSTYAEFWRRYAAMLPHHRHCYEVICEGSPCHLYYGETA